MVTHTNKNNQISRLTEAVRGSLPLISLRWSVWFVDKILFNSFSDLEKKSPVAAVATDIHPRAKEEAAEGKPFVWQFEIPIQKAQRERKLLLANQWGLVMSLFSHLLLIQFHFTLGAVFSLLTHSCIGFFFLVWFVKVKPFCGSWHVFVLGKSTHWHFYLGSSSSSFSIGCRWEFIAFSSRPCPVSLGLHVHRAHAKAHRILYKIV